MNAHPLQYSIMCKIPQGTNTDRSCMTTRRPTVSYLQLVLERRLIEQHKFFWNAQNNTLLARDKFPRKVRSATSARLANNVPPTPRNERLPAKQRSITHLFLLSTLEFPSFLQIEFK